MNGDQKNAIETFMPTLVEVLQSSLFEVYLNGNGFLTDNECQVVKASGPTNNHRIIRIFGFLKWKEGSWEFLMKYLKDHRYDWLATQLLVEAKMEMADSYEPINLQQQSTTFVQRGFAVAASQQMSNRSSNLSNSRTTSAGATVRVSPASNLANSTSKLRIDSSVKTSLGVKDNCVFKVASNSSESDSLLNCYQDADYTHTQMHRQPQSAVTKVSEVAKVTEEHERCIATLKERSKLLSFAQLLPMVISLMQKYPTAAKIQLECTRLVQPFLPQKLSELILQLRTNLVETTLTCLQSNINDESIVDCCTDTLAKLEVFADPIGIFTKTVEILLKIISNLQVTTKSRRSTIWLLGEIVWGSDENRQNLVSKMGGVKQICDVIRQQLDNPTYDRILDFSWLCLKNMCVGSLNIKKKFLSDGGMDIFHLCYEKFVDNEEIAERMMRMMQLATKRNFKVFWQILQNYSNNVAVSYQCAAVFDNFLSDPTIIWPLDSPTVEEAKNQLNSVISSWKLDSRMNISPETFEGELEELQLHKSPLCDLMLVWTFANLTTIDAPKYCQMLSKEGGVEILTTEVIQNSNSSLDSVRLALVAVENTKRLETLVKRC